MRQKIKCTSACRVIPYKIIFLDLSVFIVGIFQLQLGRLVVALCTLSEGNRTVHTFPYYYKMTNVARRLSTICHCIRFQSSTVLGISSFFFLGGCRTYSSHNFYQQILKKKIKKVASLLTRQNRIVE